MSVPPAPPLLLASTSPQRRAILTQLEIPFEVAAPDYAEVPGTGPLERAAGKAHSVQPDERPVLGVDTEVLFDGELLGKPANESEAEAMLESLAGRTHAVVSGLCLRTAAWEELHAETTLVTFRQLTPRELAPRGSGRVALAAMRSRRSGRASSTGSRATSSTSSACPPRCWCGSWPRVSQVSTGSDRLDEEWGSSTT